MSYEDYRRWRSEQRALDPSLVDRGELDLYRSLGPSFEPIAPSEHEQAPYRCHIAERLLDRLELDPSLKSRSLVTHGVRRSLAALFSMYAGRGARVAIPGDVYPTYLSLASNASLAPSTYEARLGLPSQLDAVDALLVCSPLKPWGGDGHVERAIEWARADRRRTLLIDAVYATPPSRVVLDAASRGDAVLLTSLSKGWLIPDRAGLCLVPESMMKATREAFAALDKDATKLRVAFAALTEHRSRPERVTSMLRARAAELDAWTRAHPEVEAAPCEGYFAVSSKSASELRAVGIIAIPASVFGGPATKSVLSSLEPVALTGS